MGLIILQLNIVRVCCCCCDIENYQEHQQNSSEARSETRSKGRRNVGYSRWAPLRGEVQNRLVVDSPEFLHCAFVAQVHYRKVAQGRRRGGGQERVLVLPRRHATAILEQQQLAAASLLNLSDLIHRSSGKHCRWFCSVSSLFDYLLRCWWLSVAVAGACWLRAVAHSSLVSSCFLLALLAWSWSRGTKTKILPVGV